MPVVNVLRASPTDPNVSEILSPTSPSALLRVSIIDRGLFLPLPLNISNTPLSFLNSLKIPNAAKPVPKAPRAFMIPSKDILDTKSLIAPNIGFILSHAPEITDLVFSNADLTRSITGGIFLNALNSSSKLGRLFFNPLIKLMTASPTDTSLLSRLGGINLIRYLATSLITPSPILIPENNNVNADSNSLVARSDSFNLEVRVSIALANLNMSSASSAPNTLPQALPTASNILENGCNRFFTMLPITSLPPSLTKPSARD